MSPDAPHPSLWQDLADDRASQAVRILVAIALGLFLVGAGLVACYLLATLVPQWNLTYARVNQIGTYPRDELIAVVMTFAGGAWLVGAAWLFVRGAKRHVLVRPAAYTLAVAAVTVTLCVAANESLPGRQEHVVTGVGLVGAALVLLIWLEAGRRLAAPRPVRHHLDDRPDVRCPACGYRMVGLHEARCPECGTSYTVDELIARQGFLVQAPPSPASAAPPADGPSPPPAPAPGPAADPWAAASNRVDPAAATSGS